MELFVEKNWRKCVLEVSSRPLLNLGDTVGARLDAFDSVITRTNSAPVLRYLFLFLRH